MVDFKDEWESFSQPQGTYYPGEPHPIGTKTASGGGKQGRGKRDFLFALIGGIIGALLVLLLMPWAFGVNPIDIMRGNVREGTSGTGGGTAGQVKVVTPTEGAVGVAGIAQKVTPAIVNIDIRTAPTSGFFFQIPSQEGQGSGVIYTQDGYILTNAHVVSGASEIKVTLASGQELAGRLIGADSETDIAVVKIDHSGLPTLSTGNSDNLVVGELCVAVGSPFGYEKSVTAGIISALNRDVSVSSTTGEGTKVLTGLIQTDAAINPGNSGGALCDSNASLVGINAVIATASGGSEGVGFAIPINTAKKIADDLIAGRSVSHPYIGIVGQDIGEDVAKEYGLPVSYGAYISQILQGGPAAKAGLKVGDIIVEMDGKAVKGMNDVISAVRKKKVGEKVSVSFYRGKEKKSAVVTLEEKPKQFTE